MRTNCSHFFSNNYFVHYYIDYYLYFDNHLAFAIEDFEFHMDYHRIVD